MIRETGAAADNKIMKNFLNISIIILLLNVPVVKSEDPLQHLRWRKGGVNDPKPWFLYGTKWLEKRMSKGISMIRMLSYLQIQFEKFTRKLKQTFIVSPNFLNSMTITYPTQRFEFNSSQHRLLRGYPKLEIKWTFLLHSQMRLNITFYSVKAGDIFGHCMGNSIIVQSGEAEFSFCGRHSTFNVYPPHRQVLFRIGFLLHLILETGFGLISQNVVRNKVTEEGYDFATPIFIHYIISRGFLLYTYKIVVEKYEILYIDLQATDKISTIYFDGPGFLSKKQRLPKSQNIVVLSSFQCLVQILYERTQIQPYNLWYTGYPSPMEEIHLADVEYSKISSSGSKCTHWEHTKISPCVYRVIRPINSVVTVTITKFIHSGETDAECLFGGMAIFVDDTSGVLKETYTFCNKEIDRNDTEWLFPQSFYLDSNVSVIVIYLFEEYSWLSGKLTITYSQCRLLTISPCKIHLPTSDTPDIMKLVVKAMQNMMENMYVNPKFCTILQLSSGRYETVPLKDLTRYFELLEITTYQLCSVTINLNHILYQPLATQYEITGFHETEKLPIGIAFYVQVQDYDSFDGNYSCSTASDRQRVKMGKLRSTTDIVKCFDHTDNHIFFSYNYTVKTNGSKVQINFDHWFHSWINIQITPSNDSLVSKPMAIYLNDLLEGFAIGFVLQPSLTYHKFLVLKYSSNSNKSVSFTYIVNQVPVLDVLPSHKHLFSARRRIATNRTIGPSNKAMLLAFPGKIRQVHLRVPLNDNNKYLLNGSFLSASWANINMGPSAKYMKESVEFLTVTDGTLVHLQVGNYHLFKHCGSTCSSTKKFSWNQASAMCDKIGGYLPRLFSRLEHEELIVFLTAYTSALIIPEGIFISLRANNSAMRYTFKF